MSRGYERHERQPEVSKDILINMIPCEIIVGGAVIDAVDYRLTNTGLEVLKYFDIEYLNIPEDRCIWFNYGIAYEAGKCQCMVCGKNDIVCYADSGFDGGRYAVCAEHYDFLTIASQLRRWEKWPEKETANVRNVSRGK